jgi:DNA repair protein SbcC/Rad50
VKLTSLNLQNFRQHVSTEIRFESGITGIIGPNGAGKTTLLEAVAFALYSVGRSTREHMLSQHPVGRGQMRVELEFELGRHSYRVVRGLKSADLYLDGDPLPIATSTSAVTERLQRILGMSKDEFFKTYFTGQKELAAMAVMASPDRARFLSKVLGYEKLRSAQDLVSARKSTLNAELAGLREAMLDPAIVAQAITDSSERVTDATSAVRSAEHRNKIVQGAFRMITPKWIRAQHDREKVQALAAEITANEREEASLQRNLERVEGELATMTGAKVELTQLHQQIEPLSDLREELGILDELYREEGRRKTLMEGEALLREEIEKLQARHATIERAPAQEEEVTLELEKKRAELEEAQGTLEAKRTEWVRDRQEAETKRNDLRRQYAEVKMQREQVVKLGQDGACPTCSRVLGDSLHTVVQHLTELEETLRGDGVYYKTRLDQLSEMPPEVRALDERRRTLTASSAALERKLARVQLAVQELSGVVRELTAKQRRAEQMRHDIGVIARGFDSARFDFVRAEIGRLTPLEAKAARLVALAEREPKLVAERQEYTESLHSLRSLLGTLRTRQKQMAFAIAEFDSIRKSYETCAADARAAELELHKAELDLGTAREALESALAAGEESRLAQARISQREADRRLHEELDRAFNEMRTQLNAELRPELSELATGFLRELMDSQTAELELDDKYNILILEDGIKKPVLSGGEEDIANLVLRLAVSQMIAERSGQAFSLLILDEVFGSLDETRRFNVLELLRALGDRFEQVILITHIETVRDGLDHVITVRYDAAATASVVEPKSGEATSDELELLPAGVG